MADKDRLEREINEILNKIEQFPTAESRRARARKRALNAGDRADMMRGILEVRQAHVRELTLLNKQWSPFRRDWQATFESLKAQTKQRVSELLATINTLLSAIIETDKQDGALLSARKQMAAAELSGLSGGRLANQSYARSTPAPSAGLADLTG